jgi:hypothetical protein
VGGKEKNGGHEESMDGMGSYGRGEERIWMGCCREEMVEVGERVGEQGKEKREGDEEVGKLREGPVSEETNIPVDRLDVGIDEGDCF